MCGIAGYFGEKNFVVNKNQQKKRFLKLCRIEAQITKVFLKKNYLIDF